MRLGTSLRARRAPAIDNSRKQFCRWEIRWEDCLKKLWALGFPRAQSPKPKACLLEQVPETALNAPARAILARDANERGARGIAVRAVPVRVIQEVEDLGAELHAVCPAHADVFEHGDVPLVLPGVVDPVAGRVAECPIGRTCEGRRIEPVVRVSCRPRGELAVRAVLRIANLIPRLAEVVADAGDVVAAGRPQRRAGAHQPGPRDLTPA